MFNKTFNKIVRGVLAITLAFLPLQGQALAVTFDAEGTVTAVATFSAALKKVADNSASTKISFPSGTGFANGDSYIDTSWNDNSLGFQAITINTNNRSTASPTATPKYIGIAQGSGAVGVTDSNLVVPLRWQVQDSLTTVSFSGKSGEFFFQDTLQGTRADNDPALGSSACNDKNKDKVCDKATGEYNDRGNGTAGTANNNVFDKVLWTPGAAQNRCNATSDNFEGVDWDGDCYDGAKPLDNGFASVVFGLAGLQGELAAADGTATPTAGRKSTDGNVKIYVGIDYTGADAQVYKTNTVSVQVITI